MIGVFLPDPSVFPVGIMLFDRLLIASYGHIYEKDSFHISDSLHALKFQASWGVSASISIGETRFAKRRDASRGVALLFSPSTPSLMR